MRRLFTSLLIAALLIGLGLVVSIAHSPQALAAGTAKSTVVTGCSGKNGVCIQGLPTTKADNGFVSRVISLVIGITAAVSVLFVALGGMRYVFSQGDPQGVAKAKSTIIYALIGLVVAIVAQGIVILVVGAIS